MQGIRKTHAGRSVLSPDGSGLQAADRLTREIVSVNLHDKIHAAVLIAASNGGCFSYGRIRSQVDIDNYHCRIHARTYRILMNTAGDYSDTCKNCGHVYQDRREGCFWCMFHVHLLL